MYKKTLGERNAQLFYESIDHTKFGPMLDDFVSFAADQLKLKSLPKISILKGSAEERASFGGYNPTTNDLFVSAQNRHPMDIFRTVAHELIHHKQNLEGRIKDVSKEGSTGSEIENEANAQAGILMRNFARKNPKTFAFKSVNESYEEVIQEGINDPGLFKAVFLAGGPGSGKDFMLSKTIDGNGMSEINSDVAFEFLMDKSGLDKKMPDSEREQRDPLRGKAKTMTKERQRLALAGRKGLVINGTADDPDKLAKIKTELESLGYSTMMVFVNTKDEVSKQRNIERGQRGGRTVPETIRKEKWDSVQAAREPLTKIFGKDNFFEIDNSEDTRQVSPEQRKKIENSRMEIFKKVRSFVSTTPTNTQATEWIGKEISKRGISKYVAPKIGNVSSGSGTAKADPARLQQKSIMDIAREMGLSYFGFGRFGKDGHVTHTEKQGKLVPKQVVAESLDDQFENLFTEEHGAGDFGTKKLDDRYRSDTPGQSPKRKIIRAVRREDISMDTIGPTTRLSGPAGSYMPLAEKKSKKNISEIYKNHELTLDEMYHNLELDVDFKRVFNRMINESTMPQEAVNFLKLKKYSSNLTGRSVLRFEETLDLFSNAFIKQEIYNAQFKDAYSYGLSRNMESIYEDMSKKYVSMSNPREDVLKFWEIFGHGSDFTPSSMKKTVKKVEADKTLKNSYPDMVELITDFAFVPDAIKKMKTFIKAGRIPTEPKPGQFIKPIPPMEAHKKAFSFLTDSVKGVKEELHNQYVDIFTLLMKNFNPKTYDEIVKLEDETKKHLAKKMYTPVDGRKGVPILKSDWKSIIEEEANYNASLIIDGFVNKNTAKLANIFAKKSEITKHEIVDRNTYRGILENTMRFEFSDSSGFTIYTSTIFKYTQAGNPFVQYPTRFTNVRLADGTMMKMPSEEKMIKEF